MAGSRAVRAAFDHALATGEAYHQRFRVPVADGGMRFMEARGTVIDNDHGPSMPAAVR